MNTSMPRTADTHQPWCDTEDACAGNTEDGTHWGHRHVMTWDDGEVPGRDWPSVDELAVRAALHEGVFPILDIEVDTHTSGAGELMWLTPAEGRRFAAAILAAADELESTMARRASAA